MGILDPFSVLLQIHLASPVSCSSYLWAWTNFPQVYLTPPSRLPLLTQWQNSAQHLSQQMNNLELLSNLCNKGHISDHEGTEALPPPLRPPAWWFRDLVLSAFPGYSTLD